MSTPGNAKGSGNPRTRAGLYGMGALYLAYLYYKIAVPFLTGDPYGPTGPQFALGTAILGGGAVAVGVLAWKLYKTSLPEDADSGEEDSGAEDAGE